MATVLQMPLEQTGRTRCLKSTLYSAYANLIAAENEVHSDNSESREIPKVLNFEGMSSAQKFPQINLFATLDGTLCYESSPESTDGIICDITGGQSSGRIEFAGRFLFLTVFCMYIQHMWIFRPQFQWTDRAKFVQNKCGSLLRRTLLRLGYSCMRSSPMDQRSRIPDGITIKSGQAILLRYSSYGFRYFRLISF